MSRWLERFPDHLPTPFVAVEGEIFRKNFERILEYATTHSLSCCPHFKAHKSLTLVRMLMEFGIDSFCVAKADEGIILAQLPIKHLLCTCHPVGAARLKRLATLAHSVQLRVPVDCVQHVTWLAETAQAEGVSFEVLLDIDLGLGRTGIRQIDQIMPILNEIKRHRQLSFSGVQLYPGHIWGERVQLPETYHRLNTHWLPFYQTISEAGHEKFSVSLGASPIIFNAHRIAHVNEIRPGACLMGDYWLLSENACSLDQCAVRVISSVLSVPEPGRALIDAGTKALCIQSVWSGENYGFARIDQDPEARLFKLNEEIGWVKFDPERIQLQPGDRLSLLPVIIGPTISQHRQLFLIDREKLGEAAIEAGGALC